MRERHQVRGRARGASMAMINVFVAGILSLLLVGSLLVGRVATQKYEQQAQADAVAKTAIMLAMRDGRQGDFCGEQDIEALAYMTRHNNKNRRIDVTCNEQLIQDGDQTRLRYSVSVEGQMDDTGFDMYGGDRAMQAAAAAEVNQDEFGDEADFSFPKLVLVLDYSGSMRADFGGSTRMDALKQAVVDLLDLNLHVEYGLVMYNSDVIRTVDIDGEARQQDIRDAVYSRGAGGGTNYERPLNRARRMLLNYANTGYHILFISDGYPNEGEGPAVAAARDVMRDDITIFTLLVGNGGGPRNTLIRMSGTENDPGNDEYFFEARNREQLQETFRQIIADIVCRIGPLNPPPPEGARPEDIHAFLKDPFGELDKLEYALDLENTQDPAYMFVPDEGKIRLNTPACERVLDGQEKVVVRYGVPKLVQ